MRQEKGLCFDNEDLKKKKGEYKLFHEFIDVLWAMDQTMKIWSDGSYTSVEYEMSDESIAGVSLEWLDLEKEYIGKYADETDVQSEDETIEQPDNKLFFDENVTKS